MVGNVLVSVIIPVYNVEAYVRECLDSIINQSYENLEIIIVDDGSTDCSGLICEEYRQRDGRIKLLTKTNGGLSSARNAGLSAVTGDYICFVDSDDYVHRDFVKILLDTLLRAGSDAAACDFSLDADILGNGSSEFELMSNEEAIVRLLDDDGYKCYAWNKIYGKELFADIKYPEGKLFEDIKTTYLLFKKTKTVAYIKNPLYFYRIREGSITQERITEKSYDLMEALDFLIDDARGWQRMQSFQYDRLIIGYMIYSLNFIKRGILCGTDMNRGFDKLGRIVRKNRKELLISNKTAKTKFKLLVLAYMPWLYTLLVRVRNPEEIV